MSDVWKVIGYVTYICNHVGTKFYAFPDQSCGTPTHNAYTLLIYTEILSLYYKTGHVQSGMCTFALRIDYAWCMVLHAG